MKKKRLFILGTAFALVLSGCAGRNGLFKINPLNTIADPTSTVYTLSGSESTGGNSTPHNSYTAGADSEQDGITWNITGNTNMTPWRIGGKNITGVDRSIYSKTAMSDDVGKIEFSFGTAASITVNSFTVGVYSTAAGAASGGETNRVATFSPEFAASDVVTVEKEDSTSWENCYYRFTFNVSVSGNTNRFVQFNSATFSAPTSSGPVTLPAPSNIAYNSSLQRVTWDSVNNATGYYFSSDNGSTYSEKTTNLYYDVSGLEDGNYSVKIKAAGDGGTNYNDSEPATFALTKVSTPIYESVVINKTALTGSYKDSAYIQCSASVSGQNNPSQEVTWSITSTDSFGTGTEVANKATIDQTGKIVFLDNVDTLYVWALAADGVTKGSTTVSASGLTYAPGSLNNPYSVSQAYDIIDELAADANNGQIVYVTGVVTGSVSSNQYGCSFDITDGDKTIRAYSISGATATDKTSSYYVEEGYTVLVSGALINFGGTYEVGYTSGYASSIVSSVAPNFTVTYNPNGATSGEVPIDNLEHPKYSQVTVASNTGLLARENYQFNGWNTKANPSDNDAVHYNPGQTFEITANRVLYAEWLSIAPSIIVQNSLVGYSGATPSLSFTYGNITDTSKISVVPSNDKVIVGSITANNNSGSVQLTLDKAGETTLSFRNDGNELATCLVTINQSTVTITGLPATGNVYIDETLDLGSTISVSQIGTYSTDVTWDSEDTNKATVDENGVVTGKAFGTVNIVVTSVDYPSATMSCAVNVSRAPDTKVILADAIETGDIVILACDGGEGSISQQYAGPSNTSTVYGLGQSYTTTPNKTGLTLEVVDGNSENTFAFKIRSGDNINKYLSWTTGNSLNVNATLSDNTSWNVAIDENGNAAITNAATPARQIWWNVSSPRFACYTDKSNGDGYKYTQLWKVVEPEQYLSSVTTYATLIGNETDNGGSISVDSVAIRFGARMSQEIWEAVNANWPITDYGVMLTTQAKLNTYEGSSIQEAYELGERRFTVLHSDSSVAPSDYAFYARINYKNPENYGGVTCAAPFIVAGGRYYFFTEMQFSVNTLAQYHLTHGGTSLSDAALNVLKG